MAGVGPALGIGSGIDLTTLLSNLMADERVPLTKLQSQEAQAQTKVSAFGQLRSALSTLRDAAKALTPEKFNGYTAASSDSAVATVSASNKATKTSYALEVIELAQTQKVVSRVQSGSDAPVNAGTLTFTFGSVEGGVFVPGEGETRTVPIGVGNTLADVRDAINVSDFGVTASLVSDSNGARLVLTSKETGAASAFQVTGSDNGGSGVALSDFNYDPATAPNYADDPDAAMSQLQAAADAQLKIDGIAVGSASNKVENAVDGLTFTLLKKGEATLTVSSSSSSGTSALNALITAYNDFLKTANALSVNIPSETQGEAGSTGPLAGDNTVRDLQAHIRNEIFGALEGADGQYNSLATLGVAFQQDGTLKLDTDRLKLALEADPRAVAKLFESEPNGPDSLGLGERFAATLDRFLTDDGILDARVDGLQAQTKALQNQQTAFEYRLTQIEARYRRQFTALDTMMAQMNSTSSYLTQQLAALANLNG